MSYERRNLRVPVFLPGGEDGWLGTIMRAAAGMNPASSNRIFKIRTFSQIMITTQEEDPGLSWHVRWVTNEFVPIESYHCHDLVHVIAAVAAILDKAGVKP